MFIPEWPPEANWQQKMCKKLESSRYDAGKRLNIIIVAEGAIDRSGAKIDCEMVKKVVVDELGQDTRVSQTGT